MIVCLCNRHNDRDIRAKAAEIGSTCPVTVYTALQGPPRCGRCLDYAACMLRGEEAGSALRSAEPVRQTALGQGPARRPARHAAVA